MDEKEGEGPATSNVVSLDVARVRRVWRRLTRGMSEVQKDALRTELARELLRTVLPVRVL